MSPPDLERRLRAGVIAAFAALLALSAASLYRALPGDGAVPLTIALLLAAPLLLPLPGLARGKRRTGVWSLFLVAPYLALGLTEVVSNPLARGLATGVIVTAFATSIALVAWLRVARRAGCVQPSS